jgi:AraC family transcriptional regulator
MVATSWVGRAPMGVGTLAPSHEQAGERLCDCIEILVPGEKAALTATYHTADGRERHAFVRSPMVSVIPAGQPHRLECQRPDQTLMLSLSNDFFEQQVGSALGTAAPQMVARYAAMDPFIRELGNALHADLQQQVQPNEAYLQQLAGVMAFHLARHYARSERPGAPSGGLPQHKLRRVVGFVEQHLAEPIRVEQLAHEAHLSPFHFARMFKQATGQSPHLFVLMQRVERAKALLRDTELALIEVAAQAGFRTQGHFTGVFHRYAGVTPRSFRLEARALQSG